VGAIFGFAFSTLTTLFFVVDPFAAVPLYLTMTADNTLEQKRRIARRTAIATGLMLALFGAVGRAIFKVLGISMGAFRIAGGVLLFLLAVDMLRAERSRQRTSPEEEAEGIVRDDPSVFPLAIPMLAGPGATSTVMVLVSRATAAWQFGIVLAAIVVTAVASYWILRAAVPLEKRFGQTGMNVVQRVMGLILAATAVQFVVEGVATVLPTIRNAPVG
jgi:multiple antibiotic resistance protein